MTIDLIPLATRIIVKKRGVPEKISLIYIPETSKEMEPTEGEVIRVGKDVTKVKEGDEVYFGRYSGFEFDRLGIKYIFCDEDDMLAIISPNGAKEE